MPCYSPLTGYVVGKNKNGKRDIVFSKPRKYIENVDIPCGQCTGCRLGKAQMWALRCAHEMQLHETNSFITLTYDDDHLPIDYSVNKHTLQKFIKRLRKTVSPRKISYFACGEYGETWRPHYHLIIFNYDFPDKLSTSFTQSTNPYFISAELSGLWKEGNHLIANATFETAAYVARYCLKKVNGERAPDHYRKTIMDVHEVTGEIIYYKEDVELEPEFQLMSRNPAIGKEWYKKYKTDVFPSDFLVQDDQKFPIPQYYDKLFESEDSLAFETTKLKRRINNLLKEDKPSLARLRDIENVKKLKLKTLERKL